MRFAVDLRGAGVNRFVRADVSLGMTSRLLPSLVFCLGAIGLGAIAPPVHAGSGTDPLGCDETVHDPEGLLDVDELNPSIAQTADFLNADVRVRVEPTLDGGIDERIEQLRRQCAGWDRNGQLADDLVVVMFSPTERENGIFFGDASANAPDVRWDEATDAMIPYLRSGDYTDAVSAALREMRDVSTVTSSGSSSDADDDDGGGRGGVVLVVIVLVVFAIIGVMTKVRRVASGEEGLFDSSDDESQGWMSSSGSRRRSSFGFGGSRRSGGSSRSSSRSSGSRRRAGGGSKKW